MMKISIFTQIRINFHRIFGENKYILTEFLVKITPVLFKINEISGSYPCL